MKNAVFIYGIHPITALLHQAPHRILKLWFLKTNQKQRLQPLLQLAEAQGLAIEKVRIEQLQQQVQAVGGGSHQGIAAWVRLPEVQTEQDLFDRLEQQSSKVVLALDGIQDPQNLGSCIRTAAGFGVTEVVIPKHRAVGLTASVYRVAAGAVESVRLYKITNLAHSITELQRMRWFCLGLMVDQQAQPIDQIDLVRPLLVVLGAEGKGLRRLVRARCDQLGYIPMHTMMMEKQTELTNSSVTSFNVAIATAITLYEVSRQYQVGQSINN